MKKFILFAVILSLCCSVDTFAQRKGKKKKRNATEVVEDPKFTAMLSFTAKVTVIDSVVVDSADFMNAIFPNFEEGRLTRYDHFFNDKGDGMVYVNQLGDKCIYSKKEEGKEYKSLYMSNLLFDGWTPGEELKGIDDNGMLYDFDYPYLMPDGITLYFAARGGDGLGGYDIYRTRYNQDEGKFFRPEHIGLPFNSDKDDIMYVIDEQNKLGYFASNRRQPAGKTCVYTFIPFVSRKFISGDEDKMRSLAHLEHIADTWTDAAEKNAALERKNKVLKMVNYRRNYIYSEQFNFIVNDQKIYHKTSDFRPENRERIKRLINMQRQEAVLEASLEKARNYFSKATGAERQRLTAEILSSEEQQERLKVNIKELEKSIRNTENQ